MKKFLLHILKYAVIVLLCLNLISWLSLYVLKNASFYKPEFLTHEVKETQFDYIIIGSSIGLTGLNTIQIDSLTGKKGLNLSIDDTSLSSNYLMLSHYFNQNKKTNYCVLAITSWDLAVKNPEINNNDYRFLPFVNEKYVYDYYNHLEKNYFKPLTFSHYLPFIGVSYYNTEIFFPSIVAFFKPGKRNRFDEKGNYSYPELGKLPSKKQTTVTLEWSNPYIYKIKSLCEANNTKLIVYQAPMYKTLIISNKTNFNFINHCKAIEKSDYFYDQIHLNEKGRKFETFNFAKDFKSYLLSN